VSYPVSDNSTTTSPLRLTVTAVRRGSINDLKDFQLDAQDKLGVPFYVTVRFTNVGGRAVAPGGIFGLITGYDAAGSEIDSISLIGDFPTCQGNEPNSLAAGASFTECEPYIAPPGDTITRIEYDNFVGDDETKVDWTT
jgi:hypothetical protein